MSESDPDDHHHIMDPAQIFFNESFTLHFPFPLKSGNFHLAFQLDLSPSSFNFIFNARKVA